MKALSTAYTVTKTGRFNGKLLYCVHFNICVQVVRKIEDPEIWGCPVTLIRFIAHFAVSVCVQLFPEGSVHIRNFLNYWTRTLMMGYYTGNHYDLTKRKRSTTHLLFATITTEVPQHFLVNVLFICNTKVSFNCTSLCQSQHYCQTPHVQITHGNLTLQESPSSLHLLQQNYRRIKGHMIQP